MNRLIMARTTLPTISPQTLRNMSSEQLRGLEDFVHMLTLKQRGREVRKSGLAFKTLKQIPSQDGHVHKFKRTGTKPLLFGLTPPTDYQCETCHEQAYKCPNCGYVPGLPEQRDYDNTGPLCGDAGIVYTCRICSSGLGSEVHTLS
jgi:hypothetical protein